MLNNSFPSRKAVNKSETWDISAIFSSEEDFIEAIKQLEQDSENFVKKYKKCFDDPQKIVEALYVLQDITILSSQISHYGFLPVETDRTDSDLAANLHMATQAVNHAQQKLLFFTNALLELSDDELDAIVTVSADLNLFIAEIKRQKAISLGGQVEDALLAFQESFDQPHTIYNQAKLADLEFPDFTVKGKSYPLSFVLYEDFYMYSEDTDLRRAAFDVFSQTLSQAKYTMAATYYAQVCQDKAMATLRGFDSVIDYLLYQQGGSRDLYDRQIDGLMTGLAPVMQKYVHHIKEVRGLEQMTFADLKIDLDPDFNQAISFSEAKDYIQGACQIMGPDYFQRIAPAFSESWVDYAQNKGKSTGGFCTQAAQVHPYILMSWTGLLSDVYTLIHELGHAGQMIAAEENNFYLSSEPSLYLIEAPSTFNELLLTDYLLNHADDKRTKRYAKSKMLTNTYFHNFVTHLLEAAYQREVYRLIDAGKGFSADTLSEIKQKVLTDFWGEEVLMTPGAELTWMRQPHYYMGLYSYTYSAGLTIATQAFLNIKAQKESAVTNWLEFLTLGRMPINQAVQVAGIDISDDSALQNSITFLDQTVDDIIAYSQKLGE